MTTPPTTPLPRFAAMALAHTQTHAPARFREIAAQEDPTAYFRRLGEEIRTRVLELDAQLLLQAPPATGYLAERTRREAVRREAESTVLQELLYDAYPTETSDPDATSDAMT